MNSKGARLLALFMKHLLSKFRQSTSSFTIRRSLTRSAVDDMGRGMSSSEAVNDVESNEYKTSNDTLVLESRFSLKTRKLKKNSPSLSIGLVI